MNRETRIKAYLGMFTPDMRKQVEDAREVAQYLRRKGHSAHKTEAALHQLFPAGAVKEVMEGE